MPQIIFVSAAGVSTTVDFTPGASVMETAVRNGIDGISAECGGACACSTCHVMLSETDYHRFASPGAIEDPMLDFVAVGRAPTSRLSCQLLLQEDHDGMTVTLPNAQS